MKEKPVIWVEGIIGAGKTTLANHLASVFNFRPMKEPVDENPYLELFYKEPKRWAFPMQMELLHRRYAMQKVAAYEVTSGMNDYNGVILDRGMPGDRAFALLHYLDINMSKLEWETYERCYNIMACSLIPPSLLIYLDIELDTALERIRKRARDAEIGITRNYLNKLRKCYYDMLVQIEAGQHAWSRGIEVHRVAWNADHQEPTHIIEYISQKFGLDAR